MDAILTASAVLFAVAALGVALRVVTVSRTARNRFTRRRRSRPRAAAPVRPVSRPSAHHRCRDYRRVLRSPHQPPAQ